MRLRNTATGKSMQPCPAPSLNDPNPSLAVKTFLLQSQRIFVQLIVALVCVLWLASLALGQGLGSAFQDAYHAQARLAIRQRLLALLKTLHKMERL